MLLLTVPTYFWLNTYEIPEEIANTYNLTPIVEKTSGNVIKRCTPEEPCRVYSGSNNFGWHTYTVTVWLGEFIFAIFGAVGLITLP